MIRVEIVPAGRGTAVVETYLDGRRTAMSAPLPVPAARARGDAQAAGLGGEVVDHTRERDPGARGALLTAARYGRLAFRA